MTALDLAAALLKDVKRHGGWHALDPVPVMYETEVLAALSRALDPAIAERAIEHATLLRLSPWSDGYPRLSELPDLLTALLTANAALRAERDALAAELHTMKTAGIIEVAVRNPSVADYVQHWEGRTEAAEAERDALRAERDNLSDKLELERALTDGAHRRARAAEAEVEKLRKVCLPLQNLHMWTESAEDTEMVIVSVGTVRAIRAALTTEERT